MSRKKTQYSASFKSKVVLDLLESGETLNEVASRYKILPRNLHNWKQQFLENMSLAFDKKKVVKSYEESLSSLKRENDQLAKKLGKILIERDWAVEKLTSLDLSTRMNFLVKGEAIQTQSKIKQPSLNRSMKLLSLSKTSYYYEPKAKFSSSQDQEILHKIDEIYTEFPFYGYRRMYEALLLENFVVGRKKVRSMMKFMGLRAIYPEPKTTVAIKEHEKYPYLLTQFKNKDRQVIVREANLVWSTDITYIRLSHGFVYLAAIIDWGTKKILSWKLSSIMDVSLTTSVLNEALAKYPQPQILNSDQGSQYTAKEHVAILTEKNISISMDGKGRSIDNIAIERFWRSLKYEDVYLNDYTTKKEAQKGIGEYIEKYNSRRLHSAIDYKTPDEVYFNQGLQKAA